MSNVPSIWREHFSTKMSVHCYQIKCNKSIINNENVSDLLDFWNVYTYLFNLNYHFGNNLKLYDQEKLHRNQLLLALQYRINFIALVNFSIVIVLFFNWATLSVCVDGLRSVLAALELIMCSKIILTSLVLVSFVQIISAFGIYSVVGM